MATYVMLGKLTQQGVATIKDVRQRRDAAAEAAKALGITWRGSWLTMGQYDVVILLDAPDDQAVAKFALQTAGRGNLTTQTLRAFDDTEIDSILSAL